MAKSVLTLDIRSAAGRLLEAAVGIVRRWTDKKRIVTLDIDSTSIRILETAGRTVRRWSSIPLEPDKVKGGIVSDQLALGKRVRQLMASSNVKAGKVIASLSGLYSLERILPVSSLSARRVTQEAVLQMAKETMPVSPDKLYLSWQTITAGEGKQQILIVGVPRGVVDSEVKSLRAVGVNPRVLELKAMALTRAVNKEQALILNIEPSSFDISVVVNGAPEIMRTLAWKQEDLTVEDKVEYLAVTLELTVGFYDLHHPDAPLDPATPLFITGQTSADITLLEKLQGRLRYPVEPLAPPLEYPAHLPISQYAVNIGLALRGMAPSKDPGQGSHLSRDINLLPEIYRPWRPSARQLYAFALIIIATALLFPLYQATTEAMDETSVLQRRFAILNSELERRHLEMKRRLPLEEAIKEYRTIINMGGTLTGDVEVINRAAEKLGVRVESIVHEGESIGISCQADSYTTFREYLAALEESGRFASPIPPPEGYPYTSRGDIKLKPKTSK